MTVELRAKFDEQTSAPFPQVIAPPPPETVPLPSTDTLSCGAAVKVAVTVRAASIVSVHVVPAPVQSPLHAENT